MRARGFVRLREAAALSKTPYSTIHRLVTKGLLESETLGERKAFVSLESLRSRFGGVMDG